MKTYQEIKDYVLSKGYQFFTGEMDPNFICERTSDVYTNKFTDLLHLLYIRNGKEVIETYNITTKPALFGDGSVTDPNVIRGIYGVGIIAEGQHLRCWKMMFMDLLEDDTFEFKGYPHYNNPCMHQVDEIVIFRDGDRDGTIDRSIIEVSTNDGFNGHYMGDGEDLSFQNYDLAWSLGCVGSYKSIWRKVCKTLYECSKYTGEYLSVTVINPSIGN